MRGPKKADRESCWSYILKPRSNRVARLIQRLNRDAWVRQVIYVVSQY